MARISVAVSTPCQTLQAVLDRVAEQHLEDRMIVFVCADGEALVEDELSNRLAQPLEDTQKIELVSADPRNLVAEALREVARSLDATAAGQPRIAEQLQSGETAAGIDGFGLFLKAWQICQHTLRECNRVLGRDLTQMNACDQPVHEHLAMLNERLRELRSTFEARDMVLLADIAQYELPDLCHTWRDILSELADGVLAETPGQ